MNFEDLLSMPLEESEALLTNFMESEHCLTKTPNYLKREILSKCPQPKTYSKHFQLALYSAKVCVAVAFALIFLFSISPIEFTYPFDINNQEAIEALKSDEKESERQNFQDALFDVEESASNQNQNVMEIDLDLDMEELDRDDLPSIPSKNPMNQSETLQPKESKFKTFINGIQQWFQKRKNDNR